MVGPLGPINPCMPLTRGEGYCGCLGFCAIWDDMASNLSRNLLPPWRKLIVDSSDSLLSIISIKRSWKDSRIFDRRVIVTCGTGCVEPEERILVAAISSESRTSCLVSSASALKMPPISAPRSCSTERRSAGGVLDRLLI